MKTQENQLTDEVDLPETTKARWRMLKEVNRRTRANDDHLSFSKRSMTMLSNMSRWLSVFPLTMDINDEFQSSKEKDRCAFDRRRVSPTYFTAVRDRINPTQWIRATLDVRITPDFLDNRKLVTTRRKGVLTTWDNSRHWRKSSFRPSLAARVSGVNWEWLRTSVNAFFTGCRMAWLNIS